MTKEQSRREYLFRINRVIDYIDKHLAKDLTLEKLAEVARFSPFHFHRIFKAVMGEPLYQFILRLRLEKAAALLITDKSTSITGISLDCGFSSSSAFARAFKDYFKVSASEWRNSKNCQKENNKCKELSNVGQRHSNKSKDILSVNTYINHNNYFPIWRYVMINKNEITVEVTDLPQKHVVYVRNIGPYAGNTAVFESLFQKLMGWAGPRGLLRFPETECFSIYHDDPKITEESKQRASICITVPEDTAVEGEIGKMTLPAGRYALGHFEINSDQYPDAWDFMMSTWLPESGYQPDDGFCLEMYKNDPKTHPQKKHLVDICIPVKPL